MEEQEGHQEKTEAPSEKSSEKITLDEDHPIYFDKHGRPLFGTSRPSAFAYGHPWPPTPTDVGKKRVLRPQRAASANCPEVHCPQNSSDIELALYWDRSPKWNFNLPKYVTCPVHGPVPTQKSSPTRSESSASNKNSNPQKYPTESGTDQIRPNGKANSPKIYNHYPTMSYHQEGPSPSIEESSAAKAESFGDESHNRFKRSSEESSVVKEGNDTGSKVALGEDGNGRGSATVKCSSMSKPPVIVSRNEGTSEKTVQVNDKDLKGFMSTTTYFCPLHGTYLNGVKRRNNPKFRTVVLKKDTGIQADLLIPTTNRYRESRKSKEIGVWRKPTNLKAGKKIYSGSGASGSSKNKDEDLSEYRENYKNPKKVAESKKVK
ncbi:unnamed protein product [Allacma fusca]|uniref:Uncharacterized protein n=1 Tax=Allacma fusca TaxID=39272 RepID=A0A8J2P744_9HEXA|nr:unnamed protein product [Allacma fusca]